MFINVDEVLTDLHNEPLKTPAGNPATLKWVLCEALLGTQPDEKVDGAEKYKRYQLAQKLNVGGSVEVTIEEAALLKNLSAQGWGPIVVGRVFDILEQK